MIDAKMKRVHAKPNGTSPIRMYIAKGPGAVGERRCMIDTYTDRTSSTPNTKSVIMPSKADTRLGLDFSNDKITAADMKEDAIEAIVMKGVNALR